MINWLMDLIAKSTTTKSIHHFSLDFGSALLANIIHAQSTLLLLSSKPGLAQQVTFKIILVDVKNVEIHERRYTSICFNAYTDMSVIFIKIRIF